MMRLTKIKADSGGAGGLPGPGNDFWYMPLDRKTAAGVNVTVERALTLPVVWDCLQVLSQTIGSLPYAMFSRAAGGAKTRQDNHPLAAVLADPNSETTDVEFFGQMVFDLASDGNFFAEIRPGALGPVSELWRKEPGLMTPERTSDGGRRFRYNRPDGRVQIFSDSEIWHIKALPHTRDGLRGMSPIHAGREAVAAAIAVQDYSARFFDNDCTPPFVIEHPGSFKDDQSKLNFLGAIKRWWGGKQHSPGLLEYGMKFTKVGTNNEESQFNDTKVALDHSLARLWRMPPHKVGLMDKATFSNIEQQSLEFVTDTLLPWLRLIEKSIRKHLIIASNLYFFEFNVAGLLRGDIAARYAAYAQGRQWGWLSVNEIRALENMNPVPGGDRRLEPLNMTPIGAPATGNDGKGGGAASAAEHEIVDPTGRVISRMRDGNIIRIEDHRNAA